MEQILLVVHVIIAAALIGMVLIQRSDTDGFGLGASGGSNLLSSRTTANLMTRTTAVLAALFIINSLILSILAANHRSAPSIVDTIENEQTKATLAAPAVPVSGSDKAAKVDAKESKAGTAPVEQSIIPDAPKEKPAAKHKVNTDESTSEAPAVPTPTE